MLAGTKETEELVKLIKDRNLVIFVGSAISRCSPSELPTGTQLRNGILDALVERTPQLKSQTEDIKERNPNPELIYQVIYENVGDHFFGSHEILETANFNSNHLLLAKLAKQASLRTILTTNFDHLMEDALRKEGLEEGEDFCVYYYDEEEFERQMIQAKEGARGFKEYLTRAKEERLPKIAIIKLHGTIQDKDSMIATLRQTGRGLSLNQAQILDDLLKDKHMLFVGYSGNDFDNYPKILSMADTAKGIHWNFRSEELPEYIQRLFNSYKDKGVSIIMDLRDLFKQLAEGFDMDYHEPSDPSKETKERVAQSLNEWAGQIKIGGVFLTISRILYYLGIYDGAIDCCRQLLTMAKTDEVTIAAVYINLGSVYSDKGQWDEAIRCFKKSVEIFETRGIRGEVPETYGSLGLVYRHKGQWDEAMRYFEKALEIFETRKDMYGTAQTYNNFGSAYSDKGQWDEAIRYFEKALEIFETRGDITDMAKLYRNLSTAHNAKGQRDEAIRYYKKSLEIVERLGL